jgi:hypothetical protein
MSTKSEWADETTEAVGKEQDVKRMESTALSWPARAQAIIVRDQQTYDAAAELVVEIVTLERQIIEHHKPIKEAAASLPDPSRIFGGTGP